MSPQWRRKRDVKVVVPKEDHDRLTSNMDLLVQRMSDIATRIEEQLSTGPDDQQHP